MEEDYKKWIRSIHLTNDEEYDCSAQNIWSYSRSTDIRDGINIKFGNMVNGFPFEINGIPFINSEDAYIAGAYAQPDTNSIRIQSEIKETTNGLLCKRVFRKKKENTVFMRDDFDTYNVDWMMYTVWQKCQSNTEFRSLLSKIPIDVHVVEDTTTHHGDTATFWGAKNHELKLARDAKKQEVEGSCNYKFKYELREAQNLAISEINDVGVFKGKNVMGKIIKLCSLAVIFEEKPDINFQLLNEKELYLLGQKLVFPN